MDLSHFPFVSTIIAPKGEKNLTEAHLTAFCATLTTPYAIEWLEAQIACDVYHHAPSVEALSGFDCITQATANRQKRLLLADMDSTLIEQECIDELADDMGIKAQIAEITSKAMNGELEFAAALKARVALLKDMPESALQSVYDTRITMMSGAKTLAATMKAHGAHLVIVSGGFTFFTSRVRAVLGFDEDFSNQLAIKGGKLTGEVIEPILGQQAKRDTLIRIARERSISSESVLAIGDGANDIPMLQAAGLGVACHAKPFVQAQVAAQLNYNDLSALLFAQGYKREQWVDAP